jgi:hypothetical protein
MDSEPRQVIWPVQFSTISVCGETHHLAQTSIGRLASAVKPALQAPPPAAAGLTAADEDNRTRRHQMKGKTSMKH